MPFGECPLKEGPLYFLYVAQLLANVHQINTYAGHMDYGHITHSCSLTYIVLNAVHEHRCIMCIETAYAFHAKKDLWHFAKEREREREAA